MGTEDKADRVRRLLSSYYGALAEQCEDETLHNTGISPSASGAFLTPATSSQHLANGDSSSNASPAPTPRNRRSLGIDSSAFDADRYVGRMLNDSNLPKLLNGYSQMSTEVRTLDTDMQMLIYENYNQFIAALDVIHGIRDNHEKMEEGMKQLRQKIDDFGASNDVLGAKFRGRRLEMERLQAVRSLLVALQAAFQLPEDMEEALRGGRLDEAVSKYRSLAPLLRTYAHKGAFRKGCSRVEESRQRLAAQLRAQLLSGAGGTAASTTTASTTATTGLPHTDALRCAAQLAALGEPLDVFQEDVLAAHASRSGALVGDARRMLEAMRVQQCGGDVQAVVPAEGLWDFGPGVVPPLVDFIREFDRRFIGDAVQTVQLVTAASDTSGGMPTSPSAPVEAATSTPPPAAVGPAVQRAVAGTAGRFLGAVEDALGIAAEGLAQQAGEHIQASLDSVTSATARELRVPDDWGVGVLADALHVFHNDLRDLDQLGLAPLLLQQRRDDTSRSMVKRHIAACFDVLAACVLGVVQRLAQQLAEQMAAEGQQTGQEDRSPHAAPLPTQQTQLVTCYALATQLMGGGLAALLRGLQQYEKHPWLLQGWEAEFGEEVQRHLQRTFLHLLHGFTSAAGLPVAAAADAAGDQAMRHRRASSAATTDMLSPTTEQPAPGLLLLLSRVCSFLEASAVPASMEALAMTFMSMRSPAASPGAMAAASSPRQHQTRRRRRGESADGPPVFNAGEVARQLERGAQALLDGYVRLRGLHLSSALLSELDQQAALWSAEEDLQRRLGGTSVLVEHPTARGLEGEEEQADDGAMADVLACHLEAAESEVVQLLDDGGRRSSGGGPNGGGGVGAVGDEYGGGGGGGSGGSGMAVSWSGEFSALERNVARLFTERHRAFTPLEPTQQSLLAGIAKHGLQSMVESVRLRTLSLYAMRRVEASSAQLSAAARRVAQGSDGRLLRHQAEEAAQAALERTAVLRAV